MRLKLAYTNTIHLKHDFNIGDIETKKLCHSKIMLRFQEKAVSSQISCVTEINFGRTAIATANDKQASVYYIFKQNVKHMGNHVLFKVRVGRVATHIFVSDPNLAKIIKCLTIRVMIYIIMAII